MYEACDLCLDLLFCQVGYQALNRLFEGTNTGKLLVRVSEEPNFPPQAEAYTSKYLN